MTKSWFFEYHLMVFKIPKLSKSLGVSRNPSYWRCFTFGKCWDRNRILCNCNFFTNAFLCVFLTGWWWSRISSKHCASTKSAEVTYDDHTTSMFSVRTYPLKGAQHPLGGSFRIMQNRNWWVTGKSLHLYITQRNVRVSVDRPFAGHHSPKVRIICFTES